MAKTALYRHFDASGQLLYVGISFSPFNRARQHNRASDWFASVVRIDIEWLDTRSAAEQAEYQAIKREHPLHNRASKAKAAAPHVPVIVLGERRYILVDEPKPLPPTPKRVLHTPTVEPISEQSMVIAKMVNIEARRLTSLY